MTKNERTQERARKARRAASRKAELSRPPARAQTFTDRRKEASRLACRKGGF